MAKLKKEKSSPKTADELIEEAMRAVEKEEGSEEESSADEDSSKVNVINLDDDAEAPQQIAEEKPETIGKIDLKQYVEKEAYLRLAADFENFRKRAIKERTDAEKSGRESILRGFLEILDNLERGLAQVKDDHSPLADGIRIILSQVDTWLKVEGLERIETTHQNFDPSVHDAIAQIQSDQPAGMVIEEVKRGYRWSNRLLRPATVVVSKGSSEKPEQAEE